MDKLIITVAPTGSVPRKKDTPHVPVTPDEIAETAYRCEQEGAAIIHVHCRDEDERPTSRLDIFQETVEKIRKRTKLVVMTSTSGIAGQTDEDRATPLRTNPEMGSLTTGTLNFAGRKPSVVYVNTPETVQFLAKAMLDQKIKPELEAFDVGFVQQGMRLIDSGLVEEPAHFQLVMGVDGGVPATPENLLHMRNQLPPTATYVVAGMSDATADDDDGHRLGRPRPRGPRRQSLPEERGPRSKRGVGRPCEAPRGGSPAGGRDPGGGANDHGPRAAALITRGRIDSLRRRRASRGLQCCRGQRKHRTAFPVSRRSPGQAGRCRGRSASLRPLRASPGSCAAHDS